MGCRWTEKACTMAAADGDLDRLKWLRENGCPWDINLIPCAARENHLALAQWAHGMGCPMPDDIASEAALYGHLEFVKWALYLTDPESRWYEFRSSCRVAAIGGHEPVLDWLLCSERVAMGAAKELLGDVLVSLCVGGHVRMLSKRLAQVPLVAPRPDPDQQASNMVLLDMPFCPPDNVIYDMCYQAIENGRLEVLQVIDEYLLSPQGRVLADLRVTRVEERLESLMLEAGRYGRLDIMKWLHCKGVGTREDAVTTAATLGHVNVLKWLRSIGCEFPPNLAEQ